MWDSMNERKMEEETGEGEEKEAELEDTRVKGKENNKVEGQWRKKNITKNGTGKRWKGGKEAGAEDTTKKGRKRGIWKGN